MDWGAFQLFQGLGRLRFLTKLSRMLLGQGYFRVLPLTLMLCSLVCLQTHRKPPWIWKQMSQTMHFQELFFFFFLKGEIGVWFFLIYFLFSSCKSKLTLVSSMAPRDYVEHFSWPWKTLSSSGTTPCLLPAHPFGLPRLLQQMVSFGQAGTFSSASLTLVISCSLECWEGGSFPRILSVELNPIQTPSGGMHFHESITPNGFHYTVYG